MSVTGVDISGTKIADSVVSPEGKVLNKVSYPTQAVTPNQLVETIADAATEVKDGFPVGGVYLGTVCEVSGRDKRVVQELMGLDDLTITGTHGFDICSPEGTIGREEGAEFEALLDEVKEQLRQEARSIEGVLIEPKKTSVAADYRLVCEEERPRIKRIVDTILADHPNELKVTLDKMVHEIQLQLDSDKGKAMLYMLETLGRGDVTPMYLGDDITDEHAFEALVGRGIGIFVGSADDSEVAGRTTAADYMLHTIEEVEQFLKTLAR